MLYDILPNNQEGVRWRGPVRPAHTDPRLVPTLGLQFLRAVQTIPKGKRVSLPSRTRIEVVTYNMYVSELDFPFVLLGLVDFLVSTRSLHIAISSTVLPSSLNGSL